MTINRRTVAFEYMGRYWHKADSNDWAKTQRKADLCAKNAVILLVVWAVTDRPTWDEQLKACQKAINEAGLNIKLALPPPRVRARIAKAVPQEVRDRLVAINHEPIEYDPSPERRGYVVSRCRLTGEVVSQAASTLEKVRGCRHCQSHPSRQEERRLNSRRAAQAMWAGHHSGKNKYPHVKITDEVVAYIRTHDFPSDARMSEDVANRFAVTISPSGLQYARSGNTHGYLNAQYPPVRKSASPYKKDHPAVRFASNLRRQGLSLGKISQALFHAGYRTLKGNAFSATQVKIFSRFSNR